MSTDPTRTLTTRNRFGSHLRGRFEAIRRHIVRGIRNNDALGIQIDMDDDLTPSPHRFNFPSDKEKAQAFETWLSRAVDEEIFDKYEGDRYLRSGAGRGISHANDALKSIGVDPGESDVATILNMPVHSSKLESVYTRAFENLEGITDDMSEEMSQTLTRGLGDGLGPDQIASNLSENISGIKKTRASVLAQTEIIRSHSEFTLNRFEQIGGDMLVTVKAEFSTAGDLRVCPICNALEGKTYTISEMRSATFEPDGYEQRAVNEFPVQPPVHPRCRCIVLPVVGGMTGLEVIETYQNRVAV